MKYRKIIIETFVILFAAFLIYIMLETQFPDLIRVLKSGKEQDIEEFLKDSDRWTGIIFLAILQIIQVVSVVLPGAPIQIAGGMAYGFIRGYIVCQLAYVLANVSVMFLARKTSSISDLVGEKSQNRIKKAIDTINGGEPVVMVMLLCMIPVIPNGLIPYAAAKLNIKVRDFALAVFAGSCYPIVSMVLCGKFILTGDYIVSAVLVVMNVVAVAVLYFCRQRVSNVLAGIRAKRKAEKNINMERSIDNNEI